MEAANHTNANNAVNVTTIALSLIQPSGFNPRKSFDEQALTELADSIRQHGVIQPVGLRPRLFHLRFRLILDKCVVL